MKYKYIILAFCIIMLIAFVVMVNNGQKNLEQDCAQNQNKEDLFLCGKVLKNKPEIAVNYFFNNIENIDFLYSSEVADIPNFFRDNNLQMNSRQKKILKMKLEQCIPQTPFKYCQEALDMLNQEKAL